MPVDPNSHVPIYEQIVEHIRGSVAAGVYRPGESLPSIRSLALELVVTPNTVQRAYQELERDGLAYTRKGLGVFVTENGDASALSKSETALRSALDGAIQTARSAGLTQSRIRSIFQQAMRSPEKKAGPPLKAGETS